VISNNIPVAGDILCFLTCRMNKIKICEFEMLSRVISCATSMLHIIKLEYQDPEKSQKDHD
jgi:hypothetical protein